MLFSAFSFEDIRNYRANRQAKERCAHVHVRYITNAHECIEISFLSLPNMIGGRVIEMDSVAGRLMEPRICTKKELAGVT
jgi:hypothetical protein